MCCIQIMASALWYPFQLIERLLFLLVIGYEKLLYIPLQTCLLPVVTIVPRQIVIKKQKVTIFTANGVTLARTALIMPVAFCLRWGHFPAACLLIILNDLLDHLDGIVAKAQKRVYGAIDDPLLGAFLDAFCDKVVNVLALWTILLVTDYSTVATPYTLVYMAVCCAVIGYEVVLGIVRVQDYYTMSMNRGVGSRGVTAVMEGKLKQNLESVGLALLCLAMGRGNPMASWVGVSGVLCLAISLRFAHSSLVHKLNSRSKTVTASNGTTTDLSSTAAAQRDFCSSCLQAKRGAEGTSGTGYSVALVTCPNTEAAKKLSRQLIQSKLAASVHVIPQVTSVYKWEQKIEKDGESLMVIQTRSTLVSQLATFVQQNHPYDVPEVISLKVDQGSEQYLSWVGRCTNGH